MVCRFRNVSLLTLYIHTYIFTHQRKEIPHICILEDEHFQNILGYKHTPPFFQFSAGSICPNKVKRYLTCYVCQHRKISGKISKYHGKRSMPIPKDPGVLNFLRNYFLSPLTCLHSHFGYRWRNCSFILSTWISSYSYQELLFRKSKLRGKFMTLSRRYHIFGTECLHKSLLTTRNA